MRYIVADNWKERIICELTYKPDQEECERIIEENNRVFAGNEDMQVTGGIEDIRIIETLEYARTMAENLEVPCPHCGSFNYEIDEKIFKNAKLVETKLTDFIN